jgi:hypothetical protein
LSGYQQDGAYHETVCNDVSRLDMPFLWPCYIDANGSRGARGQLSEFETSRFHEFIIQGIYNET